MYCIRFESHAQKRVSVKINRKGITGVRCDKYIATKLVAYAIAFDMASCA